MLDKKYKDLEKLLKLLDFLAEYHKISEFNSDMINSYITLLDSLNSILQYNTLLKRKDSLIKELKLSEIKKKSSLLAAKTDLLNKLNVALEKNRTRLSNFEQDYFKHKLNFSRFKP